MIVIKDMFLKELLNILKIYMICIVIFSILTRKKENKPVYLGLSILEISKTLMYEFWYDYIIPKYQDKAKLCYMDIDSFTINIKTKDVYEDIASDIERFDTSNYEVNRPLPTIKNKKVIGLMKDKLGGKIMIKFVALRLCWKSMQNRIVRI